MSQAPKTKDVVKKDKPIPLSRPEKELSANADEVSYWRGQPVALRHKYAAECAKKAYDRTDPHASTVAYSRIVNGTAVPQDYGIKISIKV